MKYIFSDFDGTLTWKEQLGPIFFDILDLITKKNSELVIVTGRSLSWAHFILTHFPMTACIAEGGGVIVENKNHQFIETTMIDNSHIEKLENAYQEVQKIKGVVVSADSFGRKTDRAIELSLTPKEALDNAKEYLKANNINFSQSNVHLNFWSGEISKFKATDYFLNKNNINQNECLYFGDSLNDESMFQHFKNSIGVSNIDRILNQLKYMPAIILKGEENKGPWGVLNHLSSVL